MGLDGRKSEEVAVARQNLAPDCGPMYVACSRDKLGRSLVFETVARFRPSALAAAKFA